jgi:DNA polymerase-4
MLEADPTKYFHVHKLLKAILLDYSPDVVMRSIDEAVLDLSSVIHTVHKGRTLEDIGREIKQRVHDEIGDAMRINIGIGPNWFLAKQAAIWHKPDGLDRIDYRNLISYYKERPNLQKLKGIGPKFEARLNAAGIRTTMDFLNASSDYLQRHVFRSIVGDDWYRKLRGHETDDRPTKKGNVGRQWVLATPTDNEAYINSAFHYLALTTGKKLRYINSEARGIIVFANSTDGDHWYLRKMFSSEFHTDPDIYAHALLLLNQRPAGMKIQSMGLSCYQITTHRKNQLSLFDDVRDIQRKEWLTTAVDEINDFWGSFKIFPANSLLGTQLVGQKIPFGGVDFFEPLLKRA